MPAIFNFGHLCLAFILGMILIKWFFLFITRNREWLKIKSKSQRETIKNLRSNDALEEENAILKQENETLMEVNTKRAKDLNKCKVALEKIEKLDGNIPAKYAAPLFSSIKRTARDGLSSNKSRIGGGAGSGD